MKIAPRCILPVSCFCLALLLSGCFLKERKYYAHLHGIAYYREVKNGAVEIDTPPFRVNIIDSIQLEDLKDMNVYVKLRNNHSYYMSYTKDGKDYEYTNDTGAILRSPFFHVTLHYKPTLSPEAFQGLYYFQFVKRDSITMR